MFFFLGRKLFSPPVGIIAAFIYSFYSIAIIYTAQMQTESITITLTVLSMLLIVTAFDRGRIWVFIAAGITSGLAAHFRLNTLTIPFAAGVAGLLQLWSTKETSVKKSLFIRLSIYTITVVVMLVPISIINSRNAGQLVLVNGSNGERLLLGANPNSQGEYYSAEPIPAEWWSQIEAAPKKERDGIARNIAKNFIFHTHPSYFWTNVVPNKFWQLLWAKHWVYVGQHRGNSMEYPFGFYLRMPLITSGFIVFLGLLGLCYRTRILSRILVWNALLQVVAIQALIIEARYRLILESILIVPCAAVIYQAFFRENTKRNMQRVLAAFCGITICWSFLNIMRFGGPNILARSSVAYGPILNQMVASEFVYKKTDPAQETIPVGEVPVDAGKCSHIAFSFHYKLERPIEKKEDYDISTAWPRILFTLNQYDDKMTTIGVDNQIQNAPDLSAFQTEGGKQWRIVELLGRTKFIKLNLMLQNTGTVTISQLQGKGPIWCEQPQP
jgi:4-amino-4-deoxy-L-arabinose transferase-like glycosyltransferase